MAPLQHFSPNLFGFGEDHAGDAAPFGESFLGFLGDLRRMFGFFSCLFFPFPRFDDGLPEAGAGGLVGVVEGQAVPWWSFGAFTASWEGCFCRALAFLSFPFGAFFAFPFGDGLLAFLTFREGRLRAPFFEFSRRKPLSAWRQRESHEDGEDGE